MEHVQLVGEAKLHRPVLLFAFTGWSDAGDGASTALETLISCWGATKLATIDPEPFTDFATVRPLVEIEDGRRRIIWPTTDIYAAATPATDVVLLVGPEPALRWRLFCTQVTGLAHELGVSRAVGLGALLAEYPHRRPTPITATSVDEALRERFDLRPPTYEGPTGIVGVLSDALATEGVPTASVWAAVPTYTAAVTARPAAIALTRRGCRIAGTEPPDAALHAGMAEYEREIADLLEDDKIVAYVRRLEEMMPGDDDSEFDVESGDATSELSLDVDDSQLVDEVEQFLREAEDQ